MTDSLIEVENVGKKFCRDLKRSLWYGMKDICSELVGRQNMQQELRRDEFWAVKGVSFQLKRGECLGLIGKNGAGKSTLLKMLNGIIKPDAGRITMRGRVSALIELGAGFNPILTGRENIYNNAAVLGMPKREVDRILDSIIDFAEIGEFINTPVQNYSSGMRVRLGFAVAAHLKPDVLIIDEVLAVGDLGFVIKCLNRMAEMIPQTATIFVSHSMPMMARISTKVMLMNKGSVDFLSDDLSEGIVKYTQLFESAKRLDQGSGEIKLLKIGIKNPCNNKYEYNDTAVLNTFDDLVLEVRFEVKPSVSTFELFVILFDGQLREVLTSLSRADCAPFLNNNSDIRTFEITIPKLVLATGRYSITLGALEHKTRKFYCRATNSIHFAVNAKEITWAASFAPAEWKEIGKIV
jgi:lipopolysaccharide transport system ATP-binding protein